MAGKRSAEGIALLSAYGDVDSDNELDDSPASTPTAPSAPAAEAPGSIVDYAHDEAAATPERKEEEIGNAQGVAEADDMQIDEGGGHENVQVSPLVQTSVKGLTPSRREDEVQTSSVQDRVNNGGNVPEAEQDALAEFWPSPPSTPCSEAVQAKFGRFFEWKEKGRNFNEDLRKSKGYRNPDFLQHAVMHENINQTGSCFDSNVFDPHGYDKSDFADALGARGTEACVTKRDMERTECQHCSFSQFTNCMHNELVIAMHDVGDGLILCKRRLQVAELRKKEVDRKEQDKRQNQRSSVDFVRATQLLTTQKVSGLAAVASHARLGEGSHTTTITTTSSVVHTAVTTTEVKLETRSNKKSKWDKASHH